MPTDKERREVARRLRELDYSDLQESLICAYLDALGIEGYADWVGIAHRLADLIEPSCDLGPSGWTSFDERLPEPGAPVLCKGKNGAYYVGKPVTFDGERTGKIWVPRGAEYRSPAAWRPVDSPPCDRGALLELADEMSMDGMDGLLIPMSEYARRIREALGVKR